MPRRAARLHQLQAHKAFDFVKLDIANRDAVHALAKSHPSLTHVAHLADPAPYGLIGLARSGELRPDERVLFIHTGGMPSLFAYQRVVLGQESVAP